MSTKMKWGIGLTVLAALVLLYITWRQKLVQEVADGNNIDQGTANSMSLGALLKARPKYPKLYGGTDVVSTWKV